MTANGSAPVAIAVSHGDRARALALGALCHGAFGAAIVTMGAALHQGMRLGVGPLRGGAAWVSNAALALSFPALHSSLLTRRGGALLDRLSARVGRELRSTTYVLVASLHILAVFALWSPAGQVAWHARGSARVASEVAFVASWLLLGKAMLDSGLGVQTGWVGWSSVVRGHSPVFPPFAQSGLFRLTRQPIYVAFTCALWTGPLLTTDRALLASLWTLYCLIGPLHKERRILAREPDRYGRYQRLVPYWLPRLTPCRLESRCESHP